VPPTDKLVELPEDIEALKAMVRKLLLEHDAEKHSADDLHIENLRLRIELDRYKKWYYGPRADRLQSPGDLAQLLLNFAEALDRKPVNPDDASGTIRTGVGRVAREVPRLETATVAQTPHGRSDQLRV
jgi:hypothetical protein